MQQVLLVSLALLAAAAHRGSALDITPGGLASSQYSFGGKPFKTLTIDVQLFYIEGTPAYFFAHQFVVNGEKDLNGYLGLQGEGSYFNDTFIGRAFIFSMWDAVDSEAVAPLAECGTFGGEGTGLSCRVKYPWVDKHWYRYSVYPARETREPNWWAASIKDLSTGLELEVGKIRTQANLTGTLGEPTFLFAEYYGEEASCDSLPFMRALINTPQGDGVNATSSSATAYGRCIKNALGVYKPELKQCELIAGI